MIRDARVLQPEFVPREVQYRDNEVDALSSSLDPVMHGDAGETTLLFGPSGAGKTCIAKFVVEKLRESVIDINAQYVNCWQDYSRFKTLYRVLDGVNQTLDIHRQSTPRDELLERVQAYDGPPYVVILDEVDQLEDPSVLYDLYRAPKLSVILISNQEADLFIDLEERLASRLNSCPRIRFEKYTIEALTEILRARVRWGLADDVVDTNELRFVADAAAGDARVAIGILRNAAREAERTSTDRLTQALLEAAVPETHTEVRQKNIETLQPQQRIVYEIIADAGEIDPATLYEEYTDRSTSPRSKRTVRKYVQKLTHYNLVTANGDGRERMYVLTR